MNGSFSVVGSILAFNLHETGFIAVLLIAAAVYAAGIWALRRGSRGKLIVRLPGETDVGSRVMKVSIPARFGRRAVLPVAAVIAVIASPATAQILPWEMTVAEIETGRVRGLAQRLAKQNLLYSLRLGNVRKADLVETADRIERLLDSLEKGKPSYSVPPPWTRPIQDQLRKVDAAWSPLHRIATASAYDTFRVSREFVPRESRVGDPLLLGYFDDLTETLVGETEALLEIYYLECTKTGLEICGVARASGYAAMLMERAAKEAVQIIAGIDSDARRKSLNATIEAYRALRAANQKSAFFGAATDPSRGVSARAAGELLASLRADWDAMQVQFKLLAAGDERNFDLPAMLLIHERLIDKTERVTAALVRYASLEYGS